MPPAALYQLLEVSETASADEVKQAYRQMCMVWHPDRFGTSELKSKAEARIKQINAAYDVLSDPTRRREHDGELRRSRATKSTPPTDTGPKGPTYKWDAPPTRPAKPSPPPPPPPRTAPVDNEAAQIAPTKFAAGACFLLISLAAALMLVLKHFYHLSMAGCGGQGGCDQAANAIVPVLHLPVASIGLAYFAALLGGWLSSRSGLSAAFQWVVRAGVLISASFITAMILQKHFCPYCAAVHAGNLGFWAMMEISKPRSRSSLRGLPVFAAIFIAATAALGGVELIKNHETARQESAQREQSIKEMTNPPAGTNPSTTQAAHRPAPEGLYMPPGGFTGRYRTGAEDAPIRIVVISDYQCPDCRAIEGQIRDLLAERSDISFSAKHFPWCQQCNRFIPTTLHSNACWAARAAETAGILRGNEGFWLMHHWLFDREGAFTDAELNASLPRLGFEPQQFNIIMQSQATLDPVKSDVEEANLLGLHFTPMVFINGHELRGFIHDSNALRQAVEAVAATHPAAGTAKDDHPPLAIDKLVGDWEAQPVRPMPIENRAWKLGPDEARIKIVIWTDYSFPMTAEIDHLVRAAMADHDDIQYIIRHYPANPECNSYIDKSSSPMGCWAARAAEAAGTLGGQTARWKMHDWLLAHQGQLGDAVLRQAAPELGLDADALLAEMNSPATQASIAQDIQVGKVMIMQGVPTIYINGKWVPRWRLDSANIIQHIIDQARKGN